MTEDVLIELRDVRKTYQMGPVQVHALAGVSVQFHQSGFYAIMGASGSGKSTLMNLVGCLDRPTSGSYMLNGQDVSSLTDDELSNIRLENIGFIFQRFPDCLTFGRSFSDNLKFRVSVQEALQT